MTDIFGLVDINHGATTHRITFRLLSDEDPIPLLIIITDVLVKGIPQTKPMIEDSPAMPVHIAWAVVHAQIQELCASEGNPPQCQLHVGYVRSAFEAIYSRLVHEETSGRPEITRRDIMPPPMTQQEAQLLAERYLQTVWRTTDQKIVPLPSEGENVFGFTLKITRVIKVEPDVMTIENLADEPVHVRVLARLIQRHGHTAWYAKLHKGVSGNYCVRLSDSRMFLLSTQEYPD